MKEVIYIIGLGRSGTTLLDVILGNNKSIVSCGELTRYPVEQGIPLKYPDDHPNSLFWHKIKSEIETDAYPNYKDLSIRRFVCEYHLFFLFAFFGLIPKSWKQDYLSFTDRLFKSIFNNISANSIVDSSKYPGRALMLACWKQNSYKFKFVFIKRNPLGFVNSYLKRDVEQRGKSWFMANLYYSIVMRFCNLAMKKLSKNHQVATITHEEFANDFVRTIDYLDIELELDLSDIKKSYKEDNSFDVGPIYYGNRVRLLKSVTIKNVKQPNSKGVKDRLTLIWNNSVYKKRNKSHSLN